MLQMLDDSDSVSDFPLSDSDEYLPSRSEDSASSHHSDPGVPPDETGDPPCTSVPQWKQPADGLTLNNFPTPPTTNCKAVPQSWTPYGYFSLFVTDEVLSIIVEETNRNAQQYISSHRIRRHSRLSKWKDTDMKETKKFLGLVIYMGVVKYPSISDYWSGDPILANEFCHSVMSRNRFQLLLRFLHFEDNENPNCESAKLYKIERITREIINNFKEAQDPGEDIVIDETMIPFRGRLGFRQYIQEKTHKYGIKLFKLTDPSGYTYNVQVYEGKSQETARDNLAKSTSVCLKLAEDYFNEGRTLTVDNFYTSVELANKCLEKSTHLQGTLRKGRKGTPQINTQIQKGQCITKERSGVVVGVWKDKRSVGFLSTKDDGKVVSTNKKIEKGKR